jgi:hypothetical protein
MRPGVNNVMLQRRAAVELLVLATSTAMFLLCSRADRYG